MFRPDSEPGQTSRLVLGLAPNAEIRSGENIEVEVLRNPVTLTTDHFALAELHGLARHLHKILGHLRVVVRSIDRKLYRLD